MKNSVEWVRSVLTERLSAVSVEVVDESAAHAGHREAPRPGEVSHLSVTVVSPLFTGRTLLERHRLVQEALGEAFAAGLHALRLRTLAPGEPND
ncbi:MAG: hypothetical protein MOGMAGMI_02077 [Candidatus Omnitrophica bacterium]|nr:hypothetical protein [Candidatus Omnitrophota bacterium]